MRWLKEMFFNRILHSWIRGAMRIVPSFLIGLGVDPKAAEAWTGSTMELVTYLAPIVLAQLWSYLEKKGK